MKTKIMKLLSNVYKKAFRKKYVGQSWPSENERENANQAIFDLLSADKPCFIGRMGTTEGAVINNYITVHSDISYFKKLLNYIKCTNHSINRNKPCIFRSSLFK